MLTLIFTVQYCQLEGFLFVRFLENGAIDQVCGFSLTGLALGLHSGSSVKKAGVEKAESRVGKADSRVGKAPGALWVPMVSRGIIGWGYSKRPIHGPTAEILKQTARLS